MATSASASDSRIVSMDQFRGYVVLGMVLVNFAGEFDWVSTHAPVLQHHNTYLSFADTIMPAFHFAVGFSLCLTLRRRLAQFGPGRAYLHFARRILGLILIGLVLEFSENKSESWQALAGKTLWQALAPLLKSGVWNTLTIIAVTSLWVLPVMARGAGVRLAYLLLSVILHLVLCYFFYFDFMVARPNWLSHYWGAESVRGLDGGPFGFLAWAVPQLAGSFAYDLVATGRRGRACAALLFAGILLSAAGYALSCLSTLYPLTDPPATSEGCIVVAPSPMFPPSFDSEAALLHLRPADPPFVQPAAEGQRQLNYWLMYKRVVTLPFQLASTGYALVGFALFVLLCDIGSMNVGLFRTFGQNPLATYVIHGIVGRAVSAYAPKDAPWPWVVGSFAVYFLITYVFVRHLEKNRIFLRM